MSKEKEKKIINIPEISRVKGHASVLVEIEEDKVSSVQLDVFEGTRFFEKIVLGHHFREIPHITSRVCAICSTGHVLAACFAFENIFGFKPSNTVTLFRELMHLGMIIESHATHIYALALPDFLGVGELAVLASKHPQEFQAWVKLRSLGAKIQTYVGGRPFHPVNLQVGGFSSFPSADKLVEMKEVCQASKSIALDTCELLVGFEPEVKRLSQPIFASLNNLEAHYAYFGNEVVTSSGVIYSVEDYQKYLNEESVAYSHAKRSLLDGKPLMVGSMARLHFFADKLHPDAANIYRLSALGQGDTNTIWNNFAQAIEVVEAIDRSIEIIDLLLSHDLSKEKSLVEVAVKEGSGVGSVECPRGTLYHNYSVDQRGFVTKADMVTPSAQNTARIELDIKEVVSQAYSKKMDAEASATLTSRLETLVRAYDPCNTCATHMVELRFK
jgi:sulfhydrogenase subunit alpha